MEMIMLVGVPGSGKSTYAEIVSKATGNTIILSSDALRKELFGSEKTQKDNARVFKELKTRMRDALAKGICVIVDATNTSARNRRSILEAVPNGCIKKALVFNTPLEKCLLRNNQRERHVPEWVIRQQVEKFEAPTLGEGFDQISIIHT